MADNSLDFASMDEYKDALVLFDTSTTSEGIERSKASLQTCRDNAEDVISKLKKFGREINIRRLNFLLMREFSLTRYDAQSFIRLMIERGLIVWKNERAIIKFR